MCPKVLLIFLLAIVQVSCQITGRTVKTKYGLVKGVLVVPPNKDLQPVEAFLGVPYASPPVGSLRFMHSIPPQPWNGVRNMDRYGPVCPQTLPDISNEQDVLRSTSRGRLNYFKRLLKYLRSQSEDCLYLNIYSPITVGSIDRTIKFPVMVFLHGESFEWGSGNPYDGSILSSYGDVVVVTLNYRLGLLGFLRPSLDDSAQSNFALSDITAALRWINENIEAFAGDAQTVTVMGHGTGAILANFLLLAPASQGLFQRAVLMSGTALSDQALARNPGKQTAETAKAVNCPVPDVGSDTLACLKFKRVTELMKVQLHGPLYTTVLGPVIDGSSVPNSPKLLMETYNELFGRYDIMYGITQAESLHLFNEATLADGITEEERNRAVRTYVRNVYETNIDAISAAVINEYTNWKSLTYDTKVFRDSLVEIISDAQTVCPVINFADVHSSVRAKSYFYVFAYQSTYGDYPKTWGSVRGDELSYVFGMPLVGGTNHLANNYTRSEMLLAEMVMTYWTNFARTGNPNHPPKQKYISLSAREKQQFDPSHVQWPTYDRISRRYLHIDLRPKVRDHYRAEKAALWLKLVPELISGHQQEFPGLIQQQRHEEVVDPPPFEHRPVNDNTPPVLPQPTSEAPIIDYSTASYMNETITDQYLPTSQALTIIILVGSCLLLLNICACIGIFYQQDRVKFRERLLNRKIFLRPARDGLPDLKLDPRAPRGISSSTLDPHSKVREWIATRSMDATSDRPSDELDRNLTIRKVKRNSTATKCDVAVGEEEMPMIESHKLLLPKVLPDLPKNPPLARKFLDDPIYHMIPQMDDLYPNPSHSRYQNQIPNTEDTYVLIDRGNDPRNNRNRLSTFDPKAVESQPLPTGAGYVPLGTPLFCGLQRHENIVPIDCVSIKDPPCPIHGYVDIYKGEPEPLYATVRKDRKKPIPPPRVPTMEKRDVEAPIMEPAIVVRPGVKRVPKSVGEKPPIRRSDPPLASSEDSGSDIAPLRVTYRSPVQRNASIQSWHVEYGDVATQPPRDNSIAMTDNSEKSNVGRHPPLVRGSSIQMADKVEKSEAFV